MNSNDEHIDVMPSDYGFLNDSTSSENNIGVVVIGKKKYAVRLLWDTPESPKEAKKALDQKAEQLETNLICSNRLPVGGWTQYGLADRNLLHVAGMRVLATSVKKTKGLSQLRVWNTDDNRWVIIGVRDDGAVVFDLAFSAEEHALSSFMDCIYTQNWDQVYCPQSWNIENAINDVPPEKYIGGYGKRITSLKSSNVKLIVIVIVIIVLVGAFFYKIQYDKKIEQQQFLLRQQQIEMMSHRKNRKVVLPDVPWSTQVKPAEGLIACVDALKSHQLDTYSIPGWTTKGSGECNVSDVTFGISKSYGTVLWLEQMAKTLPESPTVILGYNNQTAILSWHLKALAKYDKEQQVKISNKDEIEKYLTDSFAEAFIQISFHDDIPEKNINRSNTPMQVTPQTWQKVDFVINLPNDKDPSSIVSILDKVHGLFITKVTCSFTDMGENTWAINGSFYAEPVKRK